MIQALQQTEYFISPSRGEVTVVLIPPDARSERVDNQMKEHLEPAIDLSHGRIKIEQVFHLMNVGQAQVWFALQNDECISVVVTEIVEWVSGRRCLKVLLAGGYNSMSTAIEPIMTKLEEFAMLELCASVIVEGRRGWERALPEGYKFSHVAMEKELLT